MDSNTMLNLLRPLYNSFTPLEFEIVSQFQKAFDIKIVSEKFIGMNPLERSDVLFGVLDKQASQLSYEYDICFIPLTPNEASGAVQGFEDANYVASQTQSNKIASKEM